MTEATQYSGHLQDFLDAVKVSKVERIFFDIDDNPTFDKAQLTFDFKYCHSIKVVTGAGSYTVHTIMTDKGVETLWVGLKTRDDNTFASSLELHLNARAVSIENGYDDLPSKIEMDFGSRKLFIYAGEIYDKADGGVDCKINDEMILVFEKQEDAERFEKMVKRG